MHTRTSAVVAICALASVCLVPNANSESSGGSLRSQLIGTWLLDSSEQTGTDGAKSQPYGPDPKGILILDANGNFAQIFLRDDLPKVDRRGDETPEQLRAIVDGSLSLYGTYTVNEPHNTIDMHYEVSSFALFNDTDAKRTVTLNGDDLTTYNYATGRYTMAKSKFHRAR